MGGEHPEQGLSADVFWPVEGTASRMNVPRLVCQNVVAFSSSGILLGEEEDMDDIINAIFKVHENRDKLPAV